MSDVQVTINGTTGISAVAGVGDTVNVSAGAVVGPLPQLQVAAGNGITINTSGGVSTISANVTELSITSNLADLQDVSSATPSVGQALVWNGTEWGGGNLPAGTTLNGLSGSLTLLGEGAVGVSTDGQNITIGSAFNANEIEFAISSELQTLSVLRDEPLRSTSLDVNWPQIPFGITAMSDHAGNVTVRWQEPIPRATVYVVEYEKVVPLAAPQITSATVSSGDLEADVLYEENPMATDNEVQYSLDGGTTWESA